MKKYKYFVKSILEDGSVSIQSNIYPLDHDVCVRAMKKCISDTTLYSRGTTKVVSFRIAYFE